MANWEAEMMSHPRAFRATAVLAVALFITNLPMVAAPPQTSTPPSSASKPASSSTAQAAPKTGTGTTTHAPPTGPRAMTDRDVIQMVQAKISDDIVIAKIQQSKTRFDTSVQGLVALKQAGVSDGVISVMMKAGTNPPAAAGGVTATGGAASGSASKAPLLPASNGTKDAVPTNAKAASGVAPPPKPVMINEAPANYGMYIVENGKLTALGRIETKIQISKFRSLLKSYVPFVRQKVDINIPGAHSTSRFEASRPTFYAYFPPSRDVSKFKLLQCKITGQNFDQRTVANASIMFSTEQNQDEVLLDIGPTSIKDFYRIFPREDLPGGEFGFVEGDTGSKSASNIEILDVYDFGVDRKEEKLSLKDYLDSLPPAHLGDTAFLTWTKEDAQKIVTDREGKTGITGSMMGWFKRQYASLDVYWADPQFARAFTRTEMLDRGLTTDQAMKLCSLLISPDGSQYYVIVSIGGKVGSGRLIGANEGERLMRPFDASLSNNKSKDVVPAKHLEFVGGYAGVWKVDFDQNSIRGPLLNGDTQQLVFESRLNQNLEFKATFDEAKINSSAVGAAAPNVLAPKGAN
jgi:hypothetical protein